MPTYDKAITIFAPDGKLFQVEYAFEAVNRGTATVALKGKDCVILAVEKKPMAVLQDPRTIRKIQKVDKHVMCTFSGLQADARVLIDKARLESQSFRFQMEDEPTIEYIVKSVAAVQQSYTQKGGCRPFGVSLFLGGFQGGKPKLYQTEPSGSYNEWKANAIGRNASTLREFLEKKWVADLDNEAAISLGIETLLEVVENSDNMEICVMTSDGKATNLEKEKVVAICEVLNKAKQEAEEAKKNKK